MQRLALFFTHYLHNHQMFQVLSVRPMRYTCRVPSVRHSTRVSRAYFLPMLFALLLTLCCALPLFAVPKTIVLGGEHGWKDLAVTDGVTTGKGRFGYDAMQLVTDTPALTANTDLLLSFDNSTFTDSAHHYTVEKNELVATTAAVRGNGAALSRGGDTGIILRGGDTALFGRSGLIGSFTLEFWLNPSIAENGENVFSWRSSRNVNDYSAYQMITATFFNNHLEWNFSGI